ncbi:unnamed protein product [Cyprideis torosa]|uniref:Uncharacterized protein n=1 Tax=Cyprideis torosa TaxID=163714 RepID=A0A7R8W7P4_9CRUS|nr:unnamed protein product [Cyprideis torosa]CAG0886580.1 unnamed protein product [Cyprideis torosa]
MTENQQDVPNDYYGRNGPSRPKFFPGQGGSSGNASVVDSLPPEMLHMVDPFWFQFPPLNPQINAVLGMVISVMGIIAVLGNASVIYVFASTPGLRTPSNILILNLAFSDLMMMLSNFPPTAIACWYSRWVFGETICSLYAMTASMFGNASIWSLAMIAYDRYRVIVKGLAAKPLTYGRVFLIISFIWFAAISWTVFPLVGWNRYVPEGNMVVCGIDSVTTDWVAKSYILVYSIFVYFYYYGRNGPSRPEFFPGQGGSSGNASVVDSLPAEMLHMVDPFWFQFPPLNPQINAILGMVISVMGIIAVLGNASVIYVFASTPGLRVSFTTRQFPRLL